MYIKGSQNVSNPSNVATGASVLSLTGTSTLHPPKFNPLFTNCTIETFSDDIYYKTMKHFDSGFRLL